MKFILLLGLFWMSPAQAENLKSLTDKIEKLEARLTALESAVDRSSCELKYKRFSTRLNRCARGTFASSVTEVGNGVHQLECGYYQLQCQ